MRNQARWFVRSIFSPAALSNRALLIWAPLPILTLLFLTPAGTSLADLSTWFVAIGVQVLFSLIVIAGRAFTQKLVLRNPRAVVITVIVLAGAVRGVMVMQASTMITGVDVTTINLILRAGNSALIALLALGLIGVTLQFTRDYRGEYERLRERAMRLQREAVASTPHLSDGTIASWVDIKRSLKFTADSARSALSGALVSGQSLRDVADVIADALAREVRPMSHGLWSGASDAPPRLRVVHVAWDALRPWSPPLATITVLVGVVTWVSAVNRAGLWQGGLYAVIVTLVVAVLVAVSGLAGRRFPDTRAIGIATIAVTPFVVIAVAVFVSEGILGTDPDYLGALVLGIALSIYVGGAVFLRRVTAERQALLDAMQARIDAEAMDVLARRTDADTWGKSLGTFVHHSVQSELTALRMHLMEAADSQDEVQRAVTRTDALTRFDRLLALQPPWVRQRSGRTVIAEVANSWAGIADVDVTATETGTEDQWLVVGHVVEEGVANAVRSGGARHVQVEISKDSDDSLVVVIEDDGHGVPDPVNPGLGTWWLDQVAPNAWERSNTVTGTRLHVRVS